MNSSSDTPLWTLARSVKKSQGIRFVLDLLNLRTDDRAARQRFCKLYADFIPWEDAGRNELKMFNSVQGLGRLAVLRENLAIAWRMQTAWDRQVALAVPLGAALQDFHQRFARNTSTQYLRPYAPNVIAAAKTIGAILQVMASAASLRFCGNLDCTITPYFIAERSTRRFCSEVCALPAQREAKRNWWARHGKPRRKAKRKRY